MGVEASRLALRAGPAQPPGALWFATANPAYLDKTNATAVHRALRLAPDVPAFDFGGALRSGMGAFVAALAGSGSVLVVASDRRDGLPTGGDESAGGDAAAAVVVGDAAAGAPLLAEHLGGASATDEFTDRWRAPGEPRAKLWEERFGETRYLELGTDAWQRALKDAGVRAGEVSAVAVTGMHGRATKVPGRPARGGQRWPTTCRGPSASPAPPTPSSCSPRCSRPRRRARRTAPWGRGGCSPWSTWPTGPTSSSSGPPGPSPSGVRAGPWPSRWRPGPTSPTARSSPGGACSPWSRHGAPGPSASRRRPLGGARTGSSGSWARGTAPAAPSTSPRPASRCRATPSTTWSRSPWPTPWARW